MRSLVTDLYPFGTLYPMFPYNSSSSRAMDRQTEQDKRHHKEVMKALAELKGGVAVSVLAGAILPLAESALLRLTPPAESYEAAMAKWHERVSRIRGWQDKRKRKKHLAYKEAREIEKAAKLESMAKAIQRNRWWWPMSKAEAMRRAQRADLLDFSSYHEYRMELYELHCPNRFEFRASTTRPMQPEGYDDLPSIRDLHAAASISPDALLTVPIGTVKKLHKWCAALEATQRHRGAS